MGGSAAQGGWRGDSSGSAGYSSGSAATLGGGAGERGGFAGRAARWGGIKRMTATLDGCVWLAYTRGQLQQYSEGGRLQWSGSVMAGHASTTGTISALAAVGGCVWVGDSTGRLHVFDAASGALARSWRAHAFAVRGLVAAGHLVYSLAANGSVRAWPARAPPPPLLAAWRAELGSCLMERRLTVCVCVYMYVCVCTRGSECLLLCVRCDCGC